MVKHNIPPQQPTKIKAKNAIFASKESFGKNEEIINNHFSVRKGRLEYVDAKSNPRNNVRIRKNVTKYTYLNSLNWMHEKYDIHFVMFSRLITIDP